MENSRNSLSLQKEKTPEIVIYLNNKSQRKWSWLNKWKTYGKKLVNFLNKISWKIKLLITQNILKVSCQMSYKITEKTSKDLRIKIMSFRMN